MLWSLSCNFVIRIALNPFFIFRHVCTVLWVVNLFLFCFRAQPEHIIVVVGTTNLDIAGDRYVTASINIYKDFNFEAKNNDIGLIKVEKPFDLNHVSIIGLSENKLDEGNIVFLSGFGAQMVRLK